MRRTFQLLGVAIAISATALLAGCGTTSIATRALPPYEAPMNKSEFQTVRTTAYTHTESDHLEFSNHNALGGELRAADPPLHRADTVRDGLTFGLESDYRTSSDAGLQPFSLDEPATHSSARKAVPIRYTTVRTVRVVRGKRVIGVRSPKIGSAAADWARWPVGTTFRILSTGQLYRVDDYGWALAGRNTIDLYMSTKGEMNFWGVRAEPIQILQWGDREESLRRLTPHTGYKHIRRMVLELEGNEEAAAQLQ